MRSFGLSFVLLSSLVAVVACTTTSTVGENPGGNGSGVGGENGDPSSSGSPAAPAPSTTSTTAPVPSAPLDTKGVVSVNVIAQQKLGDVSPFTGEQEGFTSIRIVLKDKNEPEQIATGATGSCVTKLNGPPSAAEDHRLNVPFTASVAAQGRVLKATFDGQYLSAGTLFSPALPDGTPITVTFGPEIPALAGKSVTLAAHKTDLASPALKASPGVRETRGYTPGTNFALAWSSVAGKKWILAADANVQPVNVIQCFPADTATSFVVPSNVMDTITTGANPATQYPPFWIVSQEDSAEHVGTITVNKSTGSHLFFQLNLNP